MINLEKKSRISDLDSLTKYLANDHQCLGRLVDGKEAKRLHFIAPVLITVCHLLDGDVEIAVEEDLHGNFLNAHGHFEFMVTRGKKAVCIVEAKKGNLEQGMAQNLVGCEVAAEIGELDVVYGIVTNYLLWNFYKSCNDKIEVEECVLIQTSAGPEQESLKNIAEKIYYMLSNEELQVQ